MSKRTYAIIGTGAIGGYYGGCLQHSGHDVHFLVHSDLNHVSGKGLRIDSVNGDFALPSVNAYAYGSAMPPCDVVVIALKTTANDILEDFLPGLVHDHSTVLTLQNGLGIEDMLAELVGPERVMGGLAFVCCNKVGPGHIAHLDYGAVTLGAYTPDHGPGGITATLKEVGSDFEEAGIPIVLDEHLEAARWRKLVWNVPFNGLCALHQTTTDIIMGDPERRERAHRLMLDVQKGARACGHEITDAFIEKMMVDTDKMVAYRPSMLLDREKGYPLEIDAILGAPFLTAEAQGVELLEIERLYNELAGVT